MARRASRVTLSGQHVYLVVLPLMICQRYGALYHIDAHVGRRVGPVRLIQGARMLLPGVTKDTL